VVFFLASFLASLRAFGPLAFSWHGRQLQCPNQTNVIAMTRFDYSAPAELFPGRAHNGRSGPVGYRRFGSAADAIRFAIEDLRAEFLAGAYLEVDEERFDRHGIRLLYESADYPLARRVVDRGSASAHLEAPLTAKGPQQKVMRQPDKRDTRRAAP
jgi:hypothetical protein